MKNPWQVFEHRIRNEFPNNATQTDYVRFQRSRFDKLKTPFEEAVKSFDSGTKKMFKTHYLDILESKDD